MRQPGPWLLMSLCVPRVLLAQAGPVATVAPLVAENMTPENARLVEDALWAETARTGTVRIRLVEGPPCAQPECLETMAAAEKTRFVLAVRASGKPGAERLQALLYDAQDHVMAADYAQLVDLLEEDPWGGAARKLGKRFGPRVATALGVEAPPEERETAEPPRRTRSKVLAEEEAEERAIRRSTRFGRLVVLEASLLGAAAVSGLGAVGMCGVGWLFCAAWSAFAQPTSSGSSTSTTGQLTTAWVSSWCSSVGCCLASLSALGSAAVLPAWYLVDLALGRDFSPPFFTTRIQTASAAVDEPGGAATAPAALGRPSTSLAW
ncbi:MAG: hypothetical protein HY904_05750 [Deltaproteobacteria bacterium]|nr:hypothetical protein [Deltaproteobacteria bacterium]